MNNKYIKLSKYAKHIGVSYLTALKYFHAGKIEGYQDKDTLSIYILNPEYKQNQRLEVQDKAIIYSRVSSSDNKKSLDGQLERCKQFSLAKGLTVVGEYKEVASGLNENRKQLWKILNRNDYNYLIVEHKDRLSRFGVSFIEGLLREKGIELLVINEVVEKDKREELMEDFVSIVTSFCSRIYGSKRKKRTEEIINTIKEG